ncbi:MAG: phosphomannomutase/phosphoglucomutase [Pseudohongiellaceae bacterium]
MKETSVTTEKSLTARIPSTIFRAYDIRGIVDKELTTAGMYTIGKAIASEALELNINSLLVGYDGRISSPSFSKTLIDGILSTGCNVVDLGLVPTPLLYFATHTSAYSSGVMLTASHNPANYNGLKIVFNQTCLADNKIQEVRTRIENGELNEGKGRYSKLDLLQLYIADIRSKITLSKPLKVVIDCGNAVPSVIAPAVFEAIGCEVIQLFCTVDGSFPNHHPDPTVAENLSCLSDEVLKQNADLGVAFDGDGDRVGIVCNKGKIIPTDKILMLLVKAIAPRYPGEPIIYDVKTSAALSKLIAELGAVPVMHRSGHSFMKQKMLETNSPLGGEFAAHIFIKDGWYGFDDGIYAAARVIEFLSHENHTSAVEFASYRTPTSTPEIAIPVPDSRKFQLIRAIQEGAVFPGGEIILLDGLRVEFDFGWGLVRASNTSPALLLRFEADNEENIASLQTQFKKLILKIDSSLEINF